jgi:exopolyphosphatase/guanosine-5'-triphosphate,3'-diphosphate pyrophosphatase
VARAESAALESVVASPADAAEWAVIDLGSNTARLVLFRVDPEGSCRAVAGRKEVPRLGRDVAEDRSLSEDARRRGGAAIRRFARALERWGNPPTVGVATSAVRDAPNGPEFVAEVANETGIRLRVLTGEEEARYAYLGVAGVWELSDALVVDLGGGSMQLVETRDGAPVRTESVPLGVLRLTREYLEHDPPRDKEIDDLRDVAREELRKVIPRTLERRRIYGVGGSLRALARASVEMRDYPLPRAHGYELGVRDLEALESILTEMPAERRRSVPGIGRDRSEVIVAGLLVAQELLRVAGRDRLTVSSTGIREGLALEAAGVSRPVTTAELAHRASVSAVRRLGASWEHADAVETRAAALFEALRGRHRLGADERLALSVGAWLHDLGESVELAGHARHSAYLIRNLPLAGLTHRQVALASLAAELHEGDSLPERWRHTWRPVLADDDAAAVPRLGAILFAAERLPDLREKNGADLDRGRLALRLARPRDDEVGRRDFERSVRPLERAFDLEAELRDSG